MLYFVLSFETTSTRSHKRDQGWPHVVCPWARVCCLFQAVKQGKTLNHCDLEAVRCYICLSWMEISSDITSSTWSSGITHLDDLWKLNNSRTLRLAKGLAGTGKSELLHQIALSSILPKSREGLMFHGNESVVVFFSNDQKVSLSRIVHLFYQRIISAASTASMANKSGEIQAASMDSSSTIDSLLQECLSRLWIVRCQDWLQFRASMIALPRRLAVIKKQKASETHPASNAVTDTEMPVTIIIDSLDTFYLTEGKQAAHCDSTEDLVRNFLHTYSRSMVFASVSDMNTISNSSTANVLTLNAGFAECSGNSRSYRVDSDLGFTFG